MKELLLILFMVISAAVVIGHSGTRAATSAPIKTDAAALEQPNTQTAFMGQRKIPAVSDTAARRALLRKQWHAFQQSPRQLSVRDCFLFMLDGLDANFITQEQMEQVLEALQSRIITDSTSSAYGAMYWGWTEKNNEAGDGNNVQFCVQYGMPIKFLFDHKLSPAARNSLDQLLEKASHGVRGQSVRISYTNIILMKIWNMIALGQVYNKTVMLEEGRTLFNKWLDHIARYGNREFDSPTYSGVDMESLLLMIRFSNDQDIISKARDVLAFFLNDICAHYNPLGGYLAGAHSRAYNRVFPRDLLEEKYMNPLLGWKNNNVQLFHQLVSATLNEIGLSTYQKELINRTDRFIMQRWDSFPHAFSSHFVGRKFSIASSNQSYSPDDKAFAIYLSSKRVPEMLNITYVMEGRDDHYGTWAVEGKGEKLKHLMPANYPASGGWGKARHLMIFQQVAQYKNEMVMLASGTRDHNCINPYLNSTIILPNAFNELWLGEKKVSVPSIGAYVALDESQTFIARFEDVAVAIRVLWSDADQGAGMILYNDGFLYNPSREKFSISNNKGLRLTLKHGNNGKGAIAMWWKVVEGLQTDADFKRFRREVMDVPVTAIQQNGQIDISVKSSPGKLGVKADLGIRKRLDYYHPRPLPENYLFMVDGVEIGKPIMNKYVQKGLY